MPKCNFCKSELTHVFCDLGHQPPSNSFLTEEQLLLPETYYPLTAYVCEKCCLVQVPETKMAKDIFSEKYPYFSSESPSNVTHAKEYVEMIVERFNPKTVLEIGSNDGYMLQWFKEKGCTVLGFEPAYKSGMIAVKKGIATIGEFFNYNTAQEAIHKYDLICGINVLAHQPNINDFVEGLRIALAPEGIITMEFPWLVKTIDGMQFDQIYHEHFSYFSFVTICNIFHQHKLEVFDVDELPEHGGSLRIYVQHEKKVGRNKNHLSFRSNALLAKELMKGMNSLNGYSNFQPKINEIKVNLMEFLYDVKFAEGATVVAYGAAAKANTFMNYLGIKPDLVDCIVDRSVHKQGLYCPGSHIPVVAEEDGIVNIRPDYVLITAWNLKDEIMEQLKYIRRWGGKFVVAVPKLEVM